MRQVPRYVVIGDGRMARHLCHYFDYVAIRYVRWFRSKQSQAELDVLLADGTHAL